MSRLRRVLDVAGAGAGLLVFAPVMAMAMLAGAAATSCSSASALAAMQPEDADLIRAARVRSNRAIAAHDLAGIAAAWMDNVHVVSSTSAQTAGRAQNQQRMAAQFASRPDTVYIRRSGAVDVYPAWAVASEHGEWTGRWTEPDGALEIGGSYLAQWRKVDGQWLIQAELFVPTRCTGSRYCRQRP
jgi:ketosteroid isomerase-like protein